MKDFSKQYKNFYKNIKAEEQLKEKILFDCLNQKEEKNQHRKIFFTKKCIISFCTILIVLMIGTSFVFAKDIEHFIKTYIFKLELDEDRSKEQNKDVYTFTIENPINEKVNCDANLTENESIKRLDLEEKLEIKLLTSDFYDLDTYYVKKIEKTNQKLAYVRFEKETLTNENAFFKENVEEFSCLGTKIDLAMSFLTPYATENMKIEDIIFKTWGVYKEDFESVKINSLGIDVYFAPFPYYNKEDYDEIRSNIISYFVYEDVIYYISGNWVSKNQVLNFIKTLH